MATPLIRPSWHLSESKVTPENVYQQRREFIRRMGFAGVGLGWAGATLNGLHAADSPAKPGIRRNPEFDPKLRLSRQEVVTTYNNYYEFSTRKERVHTLVADFKTTPWPIVVDGLCENPLKLDLNEWMAMFPTEERVYRFRCVEAWSMVVPWTGFPLAKWIEKAKPKPAAKFVRFETVNRPSEMPGIERLADYPWPYTEGLRLDEALHPLTIVATGLYGKPLPKQNGGPVRLVVPWKYGYKSIKSIVKITFTEKQPATLWESLNPVEYPFESNVEPNVPHPRWSQATEREVDTGDRIPTLPYNGYGDAVASLYPKKK